jgi:hypothetical protein
VTLDRRLRGLMIDGDVSRGSVQDGVSSNVIVEEGLQGRGIGEVSDTCDMVLATVSVGRTPQNTVEIGLGVRGSASTTSSYRECACAHEDWFHYL